MANVSQGQTKSNITLNLAGGSVAAGLIGLLCFVTYALIYHDVPDKNHDILLVLVGILTTSIGVIVNFFFGSSSSNKAKDDSIATLAQTAQTAQDKLAPIPGAPDKTVNLAAGEAAVVKATDVPPTTG